MNVTPRKWYVVTTDSECVVTDANGKVLCTATAGEQKLFYATTPVVTLSDETATVGEANFKRAALALGLLGGGNSGLPAGYTRVEYLEATGPQYIDPQITLGGKDKVIFLASFVKSGKLCAVYGGTNTVSLNGDGFGFFFSGGSAYPASFVFNAETQIYKNFGLVDNETYEVKVTGEFVEVAKQKVFFSRPSGDKKCSILLFACLEKGGNVVNKSSLRLFRFSVSGAQKRQLIPALDPTGTPCLYDLVTSEPFYNSGTGDFLYPGKETTATTYSLRRPRMYAQKTKRGIRRLYHVPRGYNGTPEEYAEKHGFKLLLETPAPEEGYWTPVWHEREDCIELEWVETEPPAEELLTEA